MSNASSFKPTELQVIQTIIDNVDELPKDTNPDTPFTSMGIDSLTIIEITLILQKEYGIKIEDHEVIEAQTLKSCAQVVLSKIGH